MGLVKNTVEQRIRDSVLEPQRNFLSLKSLKDPEENCRILFRIYNDRIQ